MRRDFHKFHERDEVVVLEIAGSNKIQRAPRSKQVYTGGKPVAYLKFYIGNDLDVHMKKFKSTWGTDSFKQAMKTIFFVLFCFVLFCFVLFCFVLKPGISRSSITHTIRQKCSIGCRFPTQTLWYQGQHNGFKNMTKTASELLKRLLQRSYDILQNSGRSTGTRQNLCT